mmetsp:Transcript_8675/g.35378  ORF Transcript_8675/g.35378 Transcript_8675/m.35378 type:complete len:234 (-) Transcript_8675:528-1229(-)
MPPCCRPSAAAATALAAVPRVAASRPRATSALRRSGVPRGARRGGAQQRAAAAPAVAAATGRSFASAYTERVLRASDGGGRRGHVGDEVAQEAWEIRHLPPRELAASLVRLRSFLPLRVDALRAALDCPALLAPGAALVAASNLTEISAVVPYSVLVDALIADEPALLADGLTVTRLEQLRVTWEELGDAVRSSADEPYLDTARRNTAGLAPLAEARRISWERWVSNNFVCFY